MSRNFISIIENGLNLKDRFKVIKFLIPLILCFANIIAICLYFDGSLYIFGTLVAGIFFVKFIEIIWEMIYCFFEDRFKINSMKKQYVSNYGLNLFIDNHQTTFLYEPLLVVGSDNDKYDVDIQHKQEANFELDFIIASNYTKLLYAHRNDYIENFDCARLDSCLIDKNY